MSSGKTQPLPVSRPLPPPTPLPKLPSRWALKLALIGSVALVSYGWGFRSAGQPEYRTEIVSVPEIHSHVETKEVPTPMPDACRSAIQLINESVTHDVAIQHHAALIRQAVSDGAILIATRDMAKWVKIEEQLNIEQGLLDTAVGDKGTAASLAKEKLEACNKALK